jgi:hypothetical protein
LQGAIPADLPFIKKTSLGLIQAEYKSQEEAASKIVAGLNDFYRGKYPGVFAKRSNDIDNAGHALAKAYSGNVFPDYKVTWGTYANNLGHADYPGCFRCHDGSHTSANKKTITQRLRHVPQPYRGGRNIAGDFETLGIAQ